MVDHLDIAASLLELIQAATDAPHLEIPTQKIWDDLDAVHHHRWLSESTQHADDNRQLVGVRIQSLAASHRARAALLKEQLRKASNEKIQIMKQAELERAQVDFDVRVATLQRAADSGDIRATPAVFGVIEIRRLA